VFRKAIQIAVIAENFIGF